MIERELVECLLVLPTGLYFFGSLCWLVWDRLYGKRCRCHFRHNIYWLGGQALRARRKQQRWCLLVTYREFIVGM